MPVVTYEKPVAHIGMADWHAKVWQNHQTSDTRRSDSSALRQEARKLRNETFITTEWNTYHNNEKLIDRITEVRKWKETFELYLERINHEHFQLKEEKYKTERHLDSMCFPVAVVLECIHIRDCRRCTEITLDDVEEELKKELHIIEDCKRQLAQRCREAWEKMSELEGVKCSLINEISDKQEALEVDNEQLNLTIQSAKITFKPDPARIVKHSVPHDSWLHHSEELQQIADKELAASAKLREALFALREKVKNDLWNQRDRVDFVLRKRIFDTRRVRNEIQWQDQKTKDEMEKLLKEIHTLDEALQRKTNPLSLVETRLENRFYRPGFELTMDGPEDGLKNERMDLQKSRKDLLEKINCAKTTYNALEDQKLLLDKDLEDKNHSLTQDVRCLDARARLRIEEYSDGELMNKRQIEMTKLEKEMAPNV